MLEFLTKMLSNKSIIISSADTRIIELKKMTKEEEERRRKKKEEEEEEK